MMQRPRLPCVPHRWPGVHDAPHAGRRRPERTRTKHDVRCCTGREGEADVTTLVTSIMLGEAPSDWRAEALCRDTDPSLFFPVGTTGLALDQIDHAKQTCGECTVRQDCLDFALDTNQDSGVWGGLTEEERRVIRRKRVAAERAARRATVG